MLKKANLLAVAILGIGILLGYAAASGSLNLFQQASANDIQKQPTVAEPITVAPASDCPSCCSGSMSKADAIAISTHNAKVEAKTKQDGKKPNILIIWGDDIGGFNISAYNQGMMGYKTPNIDRVAKEGALFTDWSCLIKTTPRLRSPRFAA